MKIHTFTFNPFSENTYLLIEGAEAIVVDPGMSDASEYKTFDSYLTENGLELTDCWLTHAHIDHVLGCHHVYEKYDLTPHLHPDDLITLSYSKRASDMYGVPYTESPTPILDWTHGKKMKVLNTEVEIRFAPGHAPGHVVFIFPEHRVLIGGDVLFQGSIGRTDLPGGDADELCKSIMNQCYSLPDDMIVYSGHGPKTTIGQEKKSNPFVNSAGSGFLQRK
jgi:hydroxyacylglutathione hydrolase